MHYRGYLMKIKCVSAVFYFILFCVSTKVMADSVEYQERQYVPGNNNVSVTVSPGQEFRLYNTSTYKATLDASGTLYIHPSSVAKTGTDIPLSIEGEIGALNTYGRWRVYCDGNSGRYWTVSAFKFSSGSSGSNGRVINNVAGQTLLCNFSQYGSALYISSSSSGATALPITLPSKFNVRLSSKHNYNGKIYFIVSDSPYYQFQVYPTNVSFYTLVSVDCPDRVETTLGHPLNIDDICTVNSSGLKVTLSTDNGKKIGGSKTGVTNYTVYVDVD